MATHIATKSAGLSLGQCCLGLVGPTGESQHLAGLGPFQTNIIRLLNGSDRSGHVDEWLRQLGARSMLCFGRPCTRALA